jgi:hypothetical protein
LKGLQDKLRGLMGKINEVIPISSFRCMVQRKKFDLINKYLEEHKNDERLLTENLLQILILQEN